MAEERRELQIMKWELKRKATEKPRVRRAGPKHPWLGVGIAERKKSSRDEAERARIEATEKQKTALDSMSVPELKQKIFEMTGKRPR